MRRGGPSRLSWRRFRNLRDRLPAHSHYQTALRNSLTEQQIEELTVDHDPTRDAWTRLEHLLAGLDERMQQLLIAVISVMGGEPPELHPIYRPGVPRPEGPREPTPEELAVQKAQLLARWDGTRKHPPIEA